MFPLSVIALPDPPGVWAGKAGALRKGTIKILSRFSFFSSLFSYIQKTRPFYICHTRRPLKNRSSIHSAGNQMDPNGRGFTNALGRLVGNPGRMTACWKNWPALLT
jgi:hypothetical protein